MNDSTDPLSGTLTDSRTAPAVSVVVPAYMAATFIAESIGSVLAQTFQDFEVIVVNDGSPDTDELERALEPFRGSIVYLRQQNAGPSVARNTGIRHAKGEWIALLDSDDWWDPHFLESQMAFLHGRPNVDLVYADALIIGDSPLAGKTFMSTCPSEGEVTVESLIRARCTVLTSSVVVRKQALVDVGLFDPTQRGNEDFELWLRLAKAGTRFAYQKRVLGRRRIHDSNLSRNPVRACKGAASVLQSFSQRCDITPGERRAAEDIGDRLMGMAELGTAKAHLAAGEAQAARVRLENANRLLRSRRLSVILRALRIAPRLVVWLYTFRGRFLRRYALPA